MADEDQRGEAVGGAEGGERVRLRVVASPSPKFCEEAEVCAVQVGCVAAGIRRWLIEDSASYGGEGKER